MNATVTIPTLETERLILRAPRIEDFEAYAGFKTSDRAVFTGGQIDRTQAMSNFWGIAGQWVLRGYGLFMAELKTGGGAIGGVGIFHPLKYEEPEFGWTLYDAAHEGKGYVTEAMRKVIPWAWGVMGVTTAQSHIDEGNAASERVATALGATLDHVQTQIANAPGGEFYDDGTGPRVNIWRHHKGALT